MPSSASPNLAFPKSPAAAPPAPRGRRVTLSLKTTLVLLVMVIASTALCGAVFLRITRGILEQAKHEQVQQFAYATAALLDDDYSEGEATVRTQLAALGKVPELDFLFITDPDIRRVIGPAVPDPMAAAYQETLANKPTEAITHVGQVQVLEHNGRRCFVVSVPILAQRVRDDSSPRQTLLGYLHVGSGSASIDARLHYLEGAVILTCMVAILLAMPLAYVVVRHITVPVQKLAHAARALAAGKLSHRVFLHRSDELGELVEAFNTMAHTVETQQEQIKQANASLEAKVQQRTAELEKVNHRLHAEIAEKEDFLRAVSHDLNAPLRNIAGMASMLVLKYQSTLQADALQRLERIQKNVEVECELINELLELSRIKTRREKVEPVDLTTVVGTLSEQLSNDLETRGIALTVPQKLPTMECERTRIRQVFQNLIDNAIKYMRTTEGPKEIRISATRAPGELIFHVADTGMGIAADDLPNVFHVFRRAKNVTMLKIPGKGVGLASVKSILENYGGRIWVESQVGQGTTFHFALPIQHFPAFKQEVAA